MNTRNSVRALTCLIIFSLIINAAASTYAVQNVGSSFEINESSQIVEITTGSSRRLSFDYKVPEVIVENPEVVRATPVSATEVNLTGLKPGVSSVTFSDMDKNLVTVSVNVKMDVRKVEMAIAQHFPSSSVKAFGLQTGLMLTGHVSRADDVEGIMAVARDFYPTNVLNKIQVDGGQIVAIEVKVYEISRTKLRSLGIDWSLLGTNLNVVSGFGDLIQDFATGASGSPDQNFSFGVINNNNNINFVINALEKKNVAKLLSQPTLVAQNGRPAEFLSGGEVPIQIASGLGTNSIQFRPFGTKLDIVPIVQGEGDLILEVRAEVSEVANDLSQTTGVPGFRVRRVNTAVPMRAGQTLALAGDYNEKTESEVSGAPGLVNKPVWGAFFRKTEDTRVETELVFLITPRIINSVDASVTHFNLPGQNSEPGTSRQLHSHGIIEVPRCAEDCPNDLAAPFATNNANPEGVNRGPQHQPPTDNVQLNGAAKPIVEKASSRRTVTSPDGAASATNSSTSRGGFGYPVAQDNDQNNPR